MLLHADHLTIKFGGLTAVKDLDMQLNKGELVGLIGPNGAGKTTAFNMITGVYAPTEGKVLLEDKNITGKKSTSAPGLRPDQITALGIARTFQNIRLFTNLSVLDNVIIAHHLHLKSSLMGAVLRLPRYRREEKEMHEKAIQVLKAVGLEQLYKEEAGNLAYGQQRRLEIARALATNPKVLLLDEPAAGMNPQEGEELMQFIEAIRRDFDLTILMIEHDMKVVMGICERIYVLDHGETIAQGTPKEIQTNPRVIEAYLGVDASA